MPTSPVPEPHRRRSREPAPTRHRARREAGFSLLESMVALVLAALLLTTLFRAVSTGVLATDRADGAVLLASTARSLIDRAGGDLPLAAGRHSGTTPEGVAWALEATLADEVPGVARLWSVAVSVEHDGLRARVVTHRAAAAGEVAR